MSIVSRIKEKCKENKTSMGGLEKELGLGNGTIRLWDQKTPGSDKVIMIAHKLGVSLDWLLTGKEHGNLTPEEQTLVDTFRGCNSIGQSLIQEQADAIRQKLPAEPTDQAAGVSTSAIG